MSFCNPMEALAKINMQLFKNIQTVDESLYEVEEFNMKVVQDLPLQIGFFVYLEAKHHMLKFTSWTCSWKGVIFSTVRCMQTRPI